MSNILETSTLEYYNYWENNNFQASKGLAYSVKVSDKDGNIITLEKDGSLFAMVGLTLDANTGVMRLLDKAHDDSILAEVEMPDADYIYNCRFDEEKNAILFDVKSLYGDETSTIELDVESLVELYEAGQGIEIGEKDEVTGRRPISIKLAEGENILQVSESGLSISDSITTDDELAAAISGKADIDYVNELVDNVSGLTSGITSEIERIWNVIGTDIDDPTLDERIDSKADLDEFNDLENEVGELEVSVNELSGKVETFDERIDAVEEKVIEIDEIKARVDEVEESISGINNTLTDINSNIADIETEIANDKVEIVKIESGLPETVKEAYVLKNAIGETLGEQINIYKDSSIESIEYSSTGEHGESGQFLKITYINSDGERTVSYIDLSEVIIESEYGDGLKVVDGKVYVNIDPTSDGYLTVSENGLKLSGVFQQFADLLEVNSQQWAAINSEISERESVDQQLWNAINQESIARESADNGLESQIGIEREERQAEDLNIKNLISAETEARISSDAIISGYVDTKVNEEKERALLAEANLESAIASEVSNRISSDNEIRNSVSAETEARIAADSALRRHVDEQIVSISGQVDDISIALAEETNERIREDNEIKSELSDFRSLYAKKEYVDTKDLEVAVAAVTSATTLANQYSDLKNDYLEQELKLYCDSGHTTLQNSISENTTKINAISNLKGVTGSDVSNYDDTGNGILDVLHREFHQYKGETIHKATGAQIRNVDEVAVGRYNISNREIDQMTGIDIPSGCTIFSVGIGTSDSVRRNALEVRQDGSVYMWIEGEYMCVNDLLSMLSHETY